MEPAKPLYISAKIGALPNLQLMDLKTLEWIKRTAKPSFLKISTLRQKFTPFALKDITPFIPQKEWFANSQHISSIHGLRHILRVLINSAVINSLEGYTWSPTLMAAAATHDIRRLNDKSDEGHGLRSAEWIRQNYKSILFTKTFTFDEIEAICHIISSHELPFKQIPPEIYRKFKKPINILKAADALDRFRLPTQKWWPKKKLIQVKSAYFMMGLAKYFVYRSETLYLINNYPQKKAIFETAKEIGLIQTN
jgi:hypothetical protein